MKKLLLFISVSYISCGNFYTQKSDWKIFMKKMETEIGYKKDSLEKIRFDNLDTVKIREKLGYSVLGYSKKKLPLVLRDKNKHDIFIFKRLNLVEFSLITIDSSFENSIILTSSGADY